MTKLVVHTKSLTYCSQCVMTINVAKGAGVRYSEEPGIDTPERADELRSFKERYGFAAAPIVEAVSPDGEVIDRWAGFRPDKIKEHAG